MSFLARTLVVIGLSLVMTLILMVIHWEPERSAAGTVAETPAAVANPPEPAIERASDVRTVTTESVYDEERINWVMQDPQDIEGLSSEIRAALAGCVIPRSPKFPNVVSGEFKQGGQTDLAVLCVRGQSAAVYVFWGAAVEAPPSLGVPVASFDFIPGTFIRMAHAADISVEVRRELPIEPGMPLRISHDGIQLGNGCCATTYYWHRGRWRSYVSAD